MPVRLMLSGMADGKDAGQIAQDYLCEFSWNVPREVQRLMQLREEQIS